MSCSSMSRRLYKTRANQMWKQHAALDIFSDAERSYLYQLNDFGNGR